MIEVLFISLYIWLSIQWGWFTALVNMRIHSKSKIIFWGIVNAIGFPISFNIALYNLYHGNHDKHFKARSCSTAE